MDILFLGGLFPKDRNQEITTNSKNIIQNAANNLQWSIITGLDHYYSNLSIITLPYIGSYPLNYKKWYFKSSNFKHRNLSRDYSIGFLNFPFIKLISRYWKAKKAIKQWSENITGNSCIIVYAIHSPFLKAATDFKRSMLNVKICLIVPDLPQFMSGNRNILYRFSKGIESIIIKRCLKEIDSFVLLSDHMANALKVGNRQWIRIEGIFEQIDSNDYIPKEEDKTILYTGTLARQYGIINLLNAFDAIKDLNYSLWICGEGDCRNEIERRAKSDNRIKFFGQLPRANILTLQKKATLLVNPRTSEGDYTKYSFPSKTMEYLASGTPCIIYKLQGIPEEYYQYCIVVNIENTECLKEKILEVCSKDQSELNEFGRKAANFILENKNPISQVKKIYELLNSIDNNKI